MKKILPITLFFLAVSMGAYFFAQHQQRDTLEVDTSPIRALEKEGGRLARDDMNGWQTYTNNKYHFEIKYPPEVKVTQKKENFIVFNGIPGDQGYKSILITTATTHTGTAPEPDFLVQDFQEVIDYVKKEMKENKVYKGYEMRQIKLSGQDAISVVPKSNDSVSGYFFVFDKPYILIFDYFYPYNQDRYAGFLMTAKILSTLRLTEVPPVKDSQKMSVESKMIIQNIQRDEKLHTVRFCGKNVLAPTVKVGGVDLLVRIADLVDDVREENVCDPGVAVDNNEYVPEAYTLCDRLEELVKTKRLDIVVNDDSHDTSGIYSFEINADKTIFSASLDIKRNIIFEPVGMCGETIYGTLSPE